MIRENNTLTLSAESLVKIPASCHLSYFYENRGELFDLIISFFKDGVSKDTLCFCISSDDLMVHEIKSKITETAPELNESVMSGRIEIASFKEKVSEESKFENDALDKLWSELQETAKKKGLKEVRIIYNTSWIEKDNWKEFIASQEALNKFIKKYGATAVTTYALYWYNSVELFLGALNSCNKTVLFKENSWKTVSSPTIDIPDKDSPLYEKYALYVTSLDQIANQMLPWKEAYTVERKESVQKVSSKPQRPKPQQSTLRTPIKIEAKPSILKSKASPAKKAKARKGKKLVKKLLKARKTQKKKKSKR
jgi:hypothetical protein